MSVLVKVLVKTSAKQFDVDQHQAPNESYNTANPPLHQTQESAQEECSQVYEEETQSASPVPQLHNQEGRGADIQVVPEPRLGDAVPSLTPLQPAVPIEQAISTTGSQASSVRADQGVKCACGVHEDDGLMVLCGVCHHWQHGVCYLILDEYNAPERHICELCSKPGVPELEPTDPTLCGLSELAKEAMCLWRRTLAACKETSMSKVVPVTLARRLGVEVTVATGLINRMEKEKFFKPHTRGKRVGNQVNKEKLEEGILKYLKKLAPESEGSQTTEQMMEIDNLSKKAKDLDLSGKWQQKDQDKKTKVDKKAKSQEKGRKRSQTIQGQKFELSDSQDFSYPEPKKRRRASVATKPIGANYYNQ